MRLILLIFLIAIISTAYGDEKFLKYARLFTIVNQQDISGFTVINSLPVEHPLRLIGIRKGDIVTAVNANPIFDQSTAISAYNNKTISSVSVIRDGSKIILKDTK